MNIQSFFQSKAVAWILFVLIIIWLVCDIIIGGPWWFYLPVFLAFMSSFCNLASLYLAKISPSASKKLATIQTVLGVLFLIALLIVYYFMNK
ncbi:MAG: hypothetical protein K2K97_10630 [Muribaculaceae bacterium]|nr:hypothetical protein [Muribaculaceae bacterium]